MFINITFPKYFAIKSNGGVLCTTNIVKTRSGMESRIACMPYPLCAYTLSESTKNQNEISDLIAFFRIVHGTLHSFRFHDRYDFFAENQPVLSLSSNTFQLQKIYKIGDASVSRTITKPVTMKIFVDGSEVQSGFTVDMSTGTITFASSPFGNITATFTFDVHARLDADALDFTSKTGGGNAVNTLKIIEVL